MSPLESAECAAMARRAADLVDVATRTPGPPDEASPESPRLLASLTDR